MPQVATNLFNKTITALNAAAGPPFSSLVMQITGLNQGGYAKLFSITWNTIAENDEGAYNDLAFARLMILRNERFDPTFNYNVTTVERLKDVIWRDMHIFSPGNPAVNSRIVPLSRHINFIPSWKLNDASDYLIILLPGNRIGDPGTPYRQNLTVRGEIYKYDFSNELAARKR